MLLIDYQKGRCISNSRDTWTTVDTGKLPTFQLQLLQKHTIRLHLRLIEVKAIARNDIER